MDVKRPHRATVAKLRALFEFDPQRSRWQERYIEWLRERKVIRTEMSDLELYTAIHRFMKDHVAHTLGGKQAYPGRLAELLVDRVNAHPATQKAFIDALKLSNEEFYLGPAEMRKRAETKVKQEPIPFPKPEPASVAAELAEIKKHLTGLYQYLSAASQHLGTVTKHIDGGRKVLEKAIGDSA